MRGTRINSWMLGLALLGAIGCASDDNRILTIGVLAPLDAGLTQFGLGIRNSVELAVAQANEARLIPGWTIRVVAVDDSSDPEIGKRNARLLLDDPTVIGVVGTYNSGVAAVVLPDFAAAGIALISPGNTNPTLTLGPDRDNPERPYESYFRMVAHDGQQGSFLAEAADEIGLDTIAVIADEKPVSLGLANDIRDAVLAMGGDIVSFEIVPEGDTNYTAYAQRAATFDPDLLFFGGEYDHAALLKEAALAADLTAPLMGGDGIQADEYITALGADAEGDLASSVGTPVELEPGGEAFLAAYDQHGFDEPPSTFGPYAYDAAKILLSAAAHPVLEGDGVNGSARAAIIDNVQRITSSQLDGTVTGEIGFDEFGDTIHPVLTLYRVEDGSWTPLQP
jgi:branched-chain amino acid transport system substrate-binding protein